MKRPKNWISHQTKRILAIRPTILSSRLLMTDPNLKCLACGRSDFKTKRGLTQHQVSRRACQPLFKSNGKFSLDIGGKRSIGLLNTTTIIRPQKRLNGGSLPNGEGTTGTECDKLGGTILAKGKK